MICDGFGWIVGVRFGLICLCLVWIWILNRNCWCLCVGFCGLRVDLRACFGFDVFTIVSLVFDCIWMRSCWLDCGWVVWLKCCVCFRGFGWEVGLWIVGDGLIYYRGLLLILSVVLCVFW